MGFNSAFKGLNCSGNYVNSLVLTSKTLHADHRMSLCSVWLSQHTAIISLQNSSRLFFVMIFLCIKPFQCFMPLRS